MMAAEPINFMPREPESVRVYRSATPIARAADTEGGVLFVTGPDGNLHRYGRLVPDTAGRVEKESP
jgi:hypothetical protein